MRSQRSSKPDLPRRFIEYQFRSGADQYRLLRKKTPDNLFPRSYAADLDRAVPSQSDWWCSGFYPGSLLLMFEFTKDDSLKQEALRKLKILEKEKFNKGTHDLGFMMYCSFGNALRLFKDSSYKSILITSANSLMTRFNATTGSIKSWDHGKWQYPVIIDNMMNLELLTWATKVTGDSSYHKVAVTHANTTIKNHYRPDNSSWHVVNYDTTTGKAIEKRTAQGANDSSAWARGQAWGLYGFTMMYRETKDPAYLEQARKIADFMLGHPNMPKDKIPYWDYNAPGIPNALRDASAAAIMASALLELSEYVQNKEKDQYINVATTVLKTLGMPGYKAEAGKNGGFLLMHSVGHFPQGSEVDVPLSYADYYFIEALGRYWDMFYKGSNKSPE
ncbi:MAG: glucuronyl hydrolase [Chitinophagaceae bacterium]|nr:MAG: glucuronyl hydrolase [Chitinophagaceae bacterium]